MKRYMKHTIQIITLIAALMMSGAGEAWAQITKSHIVFEKLPTAEAGTAVVKGGGIDGRKVTITVTPGASYYIVKQNIVVQKLVTPSAAAPRRATVNLADTLKVTGPEGAKATATDYSFEIPTGYAGAKVTVTFLEKAKASAVVKASDLVYNQNSQPLFTVSEEDGGIVKFYKKNGDNYDEVTGVPEETNAGEYTYYYAITPDAGHIATDYKEIKATIKKAKLTSATLTETAKKYTGNALEFTVSKVMASTLVVPTAAYSVTDNMQTAEGTYKATITAKTREGNGLDSGEGNYEGEVTATFHIVASTVILVTSSTEASGITALDGTYILTDNVSASVFANLYDADNPKIFTGTLDGDMYTISGLSHALFNTISGGIVKNVMLSGVNITTGTNVGAIANEVIGTSDKIARIYNCGVMDGSISGSGKVGSLVGLLGQEGDNNVAKNNCYARVINCFSYADIKGGSDKGGIVGYNCYATNKNDLRSMVMNCMFYGEIAEGGNISPIYAGTNISNKDDKGVSNFNYFRAEASYVQNQKINVYNCALLAETRFLQRFEFFRHLLNGHRELAAWWATGDVANKDQMMKWVMAPDSIGTKHPYPILMPPGRYPSVVNFDADHAEYGKKRNQGGKLGVLTVNIQMGSGGVVYEAPEGASITNNKLTLNITDKDPDHFNFNYYKVQLPYYNDVGTKNYTGNRVVVGWKIVDIKGGNAGSFTTTGSDVTFDTEGNITAMPYNFSDRNCTNKDLYGTNGSNRIFNQGAYWDVPEGVTEITIQPYWAKAVFVADDYRDVVYNSGMTDKKNVGTVGGGQWFTNGNSSDFLFKGETISLTIYSSISNAITALGIEESHTVYDNAIVLVGNYHHYSGNNTAVGGNTPYTITSVDLDCDNEPDYSLIMTFKGRAQFHPLRYDFVNIPGLGMAQKSSEAKGSYNFGIMLPKGWFECTNTALFHVTQMEYERSDRAAQPIILQGGVIDQWVSAQDQGNGNKTTYFHVGGNVWFKEFHIGCHQDKTNIATKHPPISVTGGDFESFYLTGLYAAATTNYDDNAECYINGGRFGIVAGTGMEGIGNATNHSNGNIFWQIDHADITEFYGGGTNAAKPAQGSIMTNISNSHVKQFCGGPKFGDMIANKTVKTIAKDCTFGTYFGAGYGGNSYNRRAPTNKTSVVNIDWNDWINEEYRQDWNTSYSGVSTRIDYQFLPMSNNENNVARLWVEYVKFSLATTNEVSSILTGCTIDRNFYGGGSLGKVNGNVKSDLNKCTIHGSVFGAGFSASLPRVEVDSIGFRTEPLYYEYLGSYRTGVKGQTTTYEWRERPDGKKISTTDLAIDKTNHILYTNEDLTTLGTVTGLVTLNIEDGTTIDNDVFGGGESSNTAGSVLVNFKGGTARNVYGGGSMADVIGSTEVNLKGGIISGNVFGGGRGDATHFAKVGKTLVKLNEPVVEGEGDNKETTYPYNCIVQGSIFGCNDVNGSPQDSAKVYIYKTAGGSITPREQLNNIDDSQHSYHLKAVYGGGNLAPFIPSEANMDKATTYVLIDGCDMTSIRQVYGGGNAASTPATKVEVKGTYEIEELFGGGNGKDAIDENTPNLGANVGYYNYSYYDATEQKIKDYDGTDPDPEKKSASTVDDRKTNWSYGTGKANVNIYGGLIHRVFGGSNTLGNVREIALTLLDSQDDCDFKVDEAYGGGKSAPMDGAAKLEMACVPGLDAAYGGAEEAEIHNDVTLNITNGTFMRVFGGNNIRGTIDGNITVNIEETGCRPVIIGQLFGGGNQAPYGNANGGKGKIEVNVRSFTSIGDVYGGGYGKTATVTGDTYVNINVCEGDYVNQDTDGGLTGAKNDTIMEYERTTTTTAENPDGFVLDEDGKRKKVQVPVSYTLPSHAAGEIGSINNVYGGGLAARVVGNTHVNVGTEKYVPINTVSDGDDLSNVEYYTRDGSGTTESPYVYTKATGTAQANTEYYALVKGANILGNVYGGGNEADVTGSTNVTIGKKKEGE